ncbi:(2Fe-2S) ferredoxin domain-containing protein [Desulfobotulus sp. H1]|uniref:(2Fe-2S) ferredoxin domain-containing protein n=1 Tax=Desulfobotulus pelophilus TaxID=2823377 RepID=A0ABT3NA50_9BACT|nr:(2Fe-2S) ferredoxin domain-containing protein [Desulfobotulus pelophilus]MCW7754342.1 (2Fe-2S) ferredoxin domain-containing protein [Desulfobotulus pelophilus]
MGQTPLDAINELREKKRLELHYRKGNEDKIEILIGMGSSGIASGAKNVLRTFNEILNERGITNVLIRRTGSLGLDHAEPTVEIKMTGMPDIIYGKVTQDVAQQIIEKHIIGKELVCGHIYDRPAQDVVKEPTHAL